MDYIVDEKYSHNTFLASRLGELLLKLSRHQRQRSSASVSEDQPLVLICIGLVAINIMLATNSYAIFKYRRYFNRSCWLWLTY